MEKSLSELSLEELWQLFPITLRGYDPEYPSWYEHEREALLDGLTATGLAKQVARINHIGSSAVPGLVAKPTVDILLEITPETDPEAVESPLKKLGWTLMFKQQGPEPRLVMNKGYTPRGYAERVYHLHVRFLGDWNELYFRDYLLVHPEVARRYGALKEALLDTYKNNRDGYTAAKTGFIQEHTDLARQEFPARYEP